MDIDAWREVVRERIRRARGGDARESRESALWLMEQYCGALDKGHFPVREIMVYFWSAFRDILAIERDGTLTHRDVLEPLGLSRKKQRPKENARDKRNRGLLFAVAVLDGVRADNPIEQAIVDALPVVYEWKAKWIWRGSWRNTEDRESALRAAWRRYGSEVEAMPDEWLADIRTWSSLDHPPTVEYWPTSGE